MKEKGLARQAENRPKSWRNGTCKQADTDSGLPLFVTNPGQPTAAVGGGSNPIEIVLRGSQRYGGRK